MKRLFTQFSFPGGIPSHVAPETPGSIHEGGELGYALSHAYGAAFDNPDLIVACVVGDGEAETGPLATGWHGNKFLNPVRDGAVLPILHLNGYKIANPSGPGPHPPRGAAEALRGLRLHALFRRRGRARRRCTRRWRRPSTRSIAEIKRIQADARSNGFQAPAGLADDRLPHAPRAGPARRRSMARSARATGAAHQVPMGDMAKPEHVQILETWMKSYRPEELFDETGRLMPELAELAPQGERRMSANPHANGGLLLKDLKHARLPRLRRRRAQPRRDDDAEATRVQGKFLRDVMKLNLDSKNFRLVSPDETNSNRWQDVLEVTNRGWVAETSALTTTTSPRTAGSWRSSASTSARAGWRATC